MQYQELPDEVREYLMSDAVAERNAALYRDFRMTNEQYAEVMSCIRKIILREHEATDLLSLLGSKPVLGNLDYKGLALRIAIDRLWPLQQYIPRVEAVIASLGGVVPQPVALSSIDESSDEDDTAEDPDDEWAQGTARELIIEAPMVNELYLTQKPIKDLDDRLKPPTVSNWLKDFLETMGAEGASTLKRSQYLARSRNAAKLNEAEKQNLLNFLMSYEEDVLMYWEVAEEQYLMAHQELPSEKRLEIERTESTSHVSDLWDYYKSVQNNIDKQYAAMRTTLSDEVGGNMKRLADIVWDGIGLNEVDRCCAALNLMIEHSLFTDMLKTDQRFKGIVGRAIDAQYGTAAKNTWNGEVAGPVIMTLFWRLVLVEKLGIDEGRASIIADYLSRKNAERVSPLYLDLKRGVFLFRGIVYKDRQLQFS